MGQQPKRDRPSNCASNTAGSLSATAYTATYAYDPLNRLSSATAQGSYTYGDRRLQRGV